MAVTAQREGFVEPRDRDQQPGPAVARRPAAVEPPPSPPPGEAEPLAAPEPEDKPVEVVWPLTVKLIHSKPIRNHRNEYVEALTFRAPTAGDINRYGNPVRINKDGDTIIDENKMTLMMAALSGVLSPVIETLETRDWNSAAYRLRPFFLPEPALAW
jgi:hypothetical protein